MKEIILKIGTRGSNLALWQAHFLQKELDNQGIKSELVIIKTKGDKIQHLSFDKIEGKGFFTKELENALYEEKIDMAVHSMKDLPTEKLPGLVIAGVSYRENPQDLLLIRRESIDSKLPYKLAKGSVVGTSSARRKCQILHYAPQTSVKDIRGNVPTRIEKLRNGDFDAILLAAAGVQRLELDISDLVSFPLQMVEFVPAPAQGVLAYQCREGDLQTRRIIQQIHKSETSETTNVERKVLSLFDGGCHMPIGVYCNKDKMGYFHAYAMYASAWDAKPKFANLSQSTTFMLAENLFKKLN